MRIDARSATIGHTASAAAEGTDYDLVFADDAPHGVIAVWTR
jgi:hypothetical protein